jgi:RPA family protein
MKLRYIFTALAAAALAFVGCQEKERFLDEFQASKTLVALPLEGGSFEVTVKATADWAVAENDEWPNVIERYTSDAKDGSYKKGQVKSSTPSWLSIDVTSGAAGQHKITFSAEATKETRECNVPFACGGFIHTIKVYQMAEKVELPFTSCADVLKEKTVGKVYKVKGTVTDLTNYDKYGCFYVNDGTGEVYVYGSMNPTAFKPEVGDIISFEGPWTSYSNFDDVTILTLEKSLIKLEKIFPETDLPKEGGSATVLLTVKSGDLEIEIPEAATWLKAGEPTTLGGMTSVELTAEENNGGARKATVTFKVTVDGKDYFAMAEIKQLGAISEVSVEDFLKAEVGDALFKLTGKVANLQTGDYGNFDLVDATGSVYVYGLTTTPVASNDKSFPTLGVKEGDIITLVGKRAEFSGKAQVGGPAYCVEHRKATVVTISEFLAKAKSETELYKITATVKTTKEGDEYGNITLEDATGEVNTYGLMDFCASYSGKNNKSFAKLGVKVGDKITVVGYRDNYNGKDQLRNPYLVKIEAAGEGGNEGGNEGGDTPDTSLPTFESNMIYTTNTADASYNDGLATVNGVENVKTLKIGKSKAGGKAELVIPAGTKKIGVYGVAWKATKGKLIAKLGDKTLFEKEFASNDGATNVAPYTITVTASDYYEIDVQTVVGQIPTTDVTITLMTEDSAPRVITWGWQSIK